MRIVSVCVLSASKCFLTPTSWPHWHKSDDPIDPSRVAFLFLESSLLWTKCKTLSGQNLFMPPPQERRSEFNRKERRRRSSHSLLSLPSLHSHWAPNRQALLMMPHLLLDQVVNAKFAFYTSHIFNATNKDVQYVRGRMVDIFDDCTWRALCESCFGFLILLQCHCQRWRLVVWCGGRGGS